MIANYFRILLICFCIVILTSCNVNKNNNENHSNLINKVNVIDNTWINYEGDVKDNNRMTQSQFIPYNAKNKYLLNNNAYVSYYNGNDFIKTELHKGNKSELPSVEEADGIILSFNKENKNGIKLISNS